MDTSSLRIDEGARTPRDKSLWTGATSADVPWKYGFKGIKSIIKITLMEHKPSSTWSRHAPKEYGFYANVNPHHDHPRWSQATEQRIGESGRRKTLMFNGYADQVASLYAGMDLDVEY